MLNEEFEATAASHAVAAAIAVWPEYVRLPPPGKLDPFVGLTRSYLNLLILPSKENDFRPPVRSSVLRQPNAKTGVRLVNVASLRAYLRNQIDPPAACGSAPRTPHEHSEPAQPNAGVEFLRLPKSKERDPLFGLSRSFLNQLILSCEENGHRPPVLSHVLRRRGSQRGIRLINVDSLRRHIKEREEPAAKQQTPPVSEPAVFEI
jgi:hypothetical protein